MMNQFSNDISRILAISKDEAFRLSSSQIGPEHLLLGILKQKNSILTDLFSKLNIEPDSIINELEEKVLLSQTVNVDDNQMEELALNEMANNILKLSVLEARLQHNMFVDANHVVLAILHDRSNNGAKEILEQNKISYKEIVEYIQQKNQITNGLELSDDEEDIQRSPNSDKSDKRSTNTAQINQTKTPILNNFSIDLTQAARDGKLDMVVGREKEIQRVIEILCRRKKNNPILIGEPGVGKSAIAEGLAQMIAKRHTSPLLYNKRIVSLNMTAIVAGTKYRGQFEERIQALLKEIEDNPDIIVFIDEIHTLIGAGSTPGSMDAANIMKPALARGVIQCIGATTLDEYRNSIEKDGALERRFQKVLIEPTSYDQTLSILKNIKDRYERHHSVNYTDEAIEACVKLTERYITDRSFPDKAIDALDEVGSKVQIKNAKMPPSIIEKEKQIKDVEEEKRQAVEAAIQKYLPPANTRPAIVHEAMHYSMEAGGKRIRPMLLLAAHEMFPSEIDPLPACVAIECLHTYSLIHDDLPCMDNSDLRRGKPTCHKKFDETMALLAGDALLTYSFRLLADAYMQYPKVATGLVFDLADAGGSTKMIGGQVEDVLGERDGKMTPDKLNFIHHNKTAALITAAVTMGIRLADSYDELKLQAAREIGKNIGLAFQVIDDILDVTSDEATLGKTTGLDAANEKMTYVSLYGIEKSREIAAQLTQKAISDCEKLSPNCAFLKALISYMQNRIN